MARRRGPSVSSTSALRSPLSSGGGLKAVLPLFLLLLPASVTLLVEARQLQAGNGAGDSLAAELAAEKVHLRNLRLGTRVGKKSNIASNDGVQNASPTTCPAGEELCPVSKGSNELHCVSFSDAKTCGGCAVDGIGLDCTLVPDTFMHQCTARGQCTGCRWKQGGLDSAPGGHDYLTCSITITAPLTHLRRDPPRPAVLSYKRAIDRQHAKSQPMAALRPQKNNYAAQEAVIKPGLTRHERLVEEARLLAAGIQPIRAVKPNQLAARGGDSAADVQAGAEGAAAVFKPYAAGTSTADGDMAVFNPSHLPNPPRWLIQFIASRLRTLPLSTEDDALLTWLRTLKSALAKAARQVKPHSSEAEKKQVPNQKKKMTNAERFRLQLPPVAPKALADRPNKPAPFRLPGIAYTDEEIEAMGWDDLRRQPKAAAAEAESSSNTIDSESEVADSKVWIQVLQAAMDSEDTAATIRKDVLESIWQLLDFVAEAEESQISSKVAEAHKERKLAAQKDQDGPKGRQDRNAKKGDVPFADRLTAKQKALLPGPRLARGKANAPPADAPLMDQLDSSREKGASGPETGGESEIRHMRLKADVAAPQQAHDPAPAHEHLDQAEIVAQYLRGQAAMGDAAHEAQAKLEAAAAELGQGGALKARPDLVVDVRVGPAQQKALPLLAEHQEGRAGARKDRLAKAAELAAKSEAEQLPQISREKGQSESDAADIIDPPTLAAANGQEEDSEEGDHDVLLSLRDLLDAKERELSDLRARVEASLSKAQSRKQKPGGVRAEAQGVKPVAKKPGVQPVEGTVHEHHGLSLGRGQARAKAEAVLHANDLQADVLDPFEEHVRLAKLETNKKLAVQHQAEYQPDLDLPLPDLAGGNIQQEIKVAKSGELAYDPQRDFDDVKESKNKPWMAGMAKARPRAHKAADAAVPAF